MLDHTLLCLSSFDYLTPISRKGVWGYFSKMDEVKKKKIIFIFSA
jgi:hypothetical protein